METWETWKSVAAIIVAIMILVTGIALAVFLSPEQDNSKVTRKGRANTGEQNRGSEGADSEERRGEDLDSEPLPDVTSESETESEIETEDEIPASIWVLSPKSGESLSGVTKISWSTSGFNPQEAEITLEYTTDPPPVCAACPPQKWTEIASGEVDDGSFEWDTKGMKNGNMYMLKVRAKDEKNSVEDTSEIFSIAN